MKLIETQDTALESSSKSFPGVWDGVQETKIFARLFAKRSSASGLVQKANIHRETLDLSSVRAMSPIARPNL